MKKKKIFVGLLAFILLFTGCGPKEEKNASTSSIKGRYVENSVSLPESLDKKSELKLSKKNGMPFLYAFSTVEPYTIAGYQMNQDGTWSEDTPNWLKSNSLLKKGFYQPEVFEDTIGNQYLYYGELINESIKGNLLRSTDGNNYKTVSPEGWDVVDPEYGYYRAPQKITALEDGTLAALYFNGEVEFYDKDNLSKQKSITDSQNVDTILTAADNSLILGQKDNNDKIVSIDVYDTTTFNKVSYPFQSDFYGYTYFDMNDKNEMILCDNEGIHVLEQGTSLWQTVLDGTLTSLSMQTMWYMGFVAGSDNNYYVLYASNNGYTLMKYTYDKTIDAVPSTELTIYSLKNNATLRQAAALFQQAHPDVKVSFTIAMTDEEYRAADSASKEDYIRALNTELLAGGGPDILVLDELPADSFVKKGALSDISNIIQPMIDKEELYPNIMNHYKKDNKIYYVPARFTLQLLCGRTSDVENLSTLDALAEYAADHKDNSLFGNMTLDDFITTFAPYLTDKIMNEEGKINKENLVGELEKLKLIGDSTGIIDEYSQNSIKGNRVLNLAQNKLTLNSCDGFNNAMLPIGMVEYVKGSYTVFENSFLPSCELGINKTSKNQELSKEFISLILSEEIQKDDFYDGFSVNKNALVLNAQADRSNIAFGTSFTSEDGTSEVYTFEALSKEQTEKLVQNCSKASNKISYNEQIMKTLIEETKEFFQGNRAAVETADVIIEKTSVYLSE